ncbi:hypothetical protein [Permianibacter aggregans]|nr:hypothetical protein [Permianibacter aggregans]
MMVITGISGKTLRRNDGLTTKAAVFAIGGQSPMISRSQKPSQK